MLRNLGIRWQVLLAVALPVLILGIVGARVYARGSGDLRAADRSAAIADLAVELTGVTDALSAERTQSVRSLLRTRGADTALKAARGVSDRAVLEFRVVLSTVVASPGSQPAIARAQAAQLRRTDLRAAVDGRRLTPAGAAARYTQVAVAPQVAALTALASPSGPATDLQQAALLARAAEAVAQEQLAGAAVLRAGRATVADQRALAAATATLSTIRLLRNQAIEAAGQSAADQHAAAVRARLAGIGVIGLAVLLGLLAGLVASRRLGARLGGPAPAYEPDLDPLATATATATAPEVGRLAAALAEVNDGTVELARDQARLAAATSDMFLNLARRNQALVARQLTQLAQLERSGAQAEDLFRLDLLATRMRRNAESLFVLAGIDAGRRQREPLLLSDVVRIAVGEVEQHARVALRPGPDPAVAAHLVLPLVHLLAELVENATRFSGPEGAVTVAITEPPGGPDSDPGALRITVADQGLGMSDPELAAANALIRERPGADALASQRLGLVVVGRLAEQLDAAVHLASQPARGTAAAVELPASLFVAGPAAPLAGTPGVRGVLGPALAPADWHPEGGGAAPLVPSGPAPAVAYSSSQYSGSQPNYGTASYETVTHQGSVAEPAAEFGYDAEYEPVSYAGSAVTHPADDRPAQLPVEHDGAELADELAAELVDGYSVQYKDDRPAEPTYRLAPSPAPSLAPSPAQPLPIQPQPVVSPNAPYEPDAPYALHEPDAPYAPFDPEAERPNLPWAPAVPPADTFTPDTFAPDTFAPGTFAPEAFAPGTFDPDTFAPDTFAPDTFAPDTFAPDAFTPDAFAEALGADVPADPPPPPTSAASINVLPQRTSIRTALLRGRRPRHGAAPAEPTSTILPVEPDRDLAGPSAFTPETLSEPSRWSRPAGEDSP